MWRFVPKRVRRPEDTRRCAHLLIKVLNIYPRVDLQYEGHTDTTAPGSQLRTRSASQWGRERCSPDSDITADFLAIIHCVWCCAIHRCRSSSPRSAAESRRARRERGNALTDRHLLHQRLCCVAHDTVRYRSAEGYGVQGRVGRALQNGLCGPP